MLAKILANGDAIVSAVEWPSVDAGSTRPAYDPSVSAHGNAADVMQLQADLAAVRAELAKAKTDSERRAQEAFVAGKREGDAMARQAVDEQLQAEMANIRNLMRDLNAAGPKMRKQVEEEVVRLSIAVARRIIHRELTIDPDALVGLIKAAFARLDQREIKQIRTDQQSVDTVRKIVAALPAPESVKVVGDPTLRPGSIVIDIPRGQLDASVDTQLREIERGFVDLVRHS
ncbi:MAG: hypothetical protein JOZ62_00990 [Acidobacteriaceae bacterium]|nr:hypothetical protein [Acidobacteriaceae bacterium]